MDWDTTDISSLAIIDREVSNNRFSPAEYEIIRRVIYRTGDFEYYSLLKFSESALRQGTVALSAYTSIIVDIPAIQLEIAPLLYDTFCNPVYCCSSVAVKPEPGKTKYASGLKVLAQRYPEGIYLIGQEETAFATLIDLIRKEIIQPSLVIVTAPLFSGQNNRKWLRNSSIPYICLKKRKGGANVAISIIEGLIDLAWCDRNNL